VHHVALAVEDLDEAVSTYVQYFGAQVEERARVDEQGVDAVYLRVGAGRVELVSPLGDDTPVGRFLAKRGPGLHHVAYQVSDIAVTLARLREQGVRMIDTVPRTGIRGSKVAFLHPSASGSVLTEIVQQATLHP
jgi:methylmalonyl-CoA/ethylmalonyl-CoA epimerase